MKWSALFSVFLSVPVLASCPPLGDVNGDGVATIVDTQCVIQHAVAALGSGPTPTCAPALNADLDCNVQVNVIDIQLAIAGTLGQPLSSSIDVNQDGCVDSCPNPCVDIVCTGTALSTCQVTPVEDGAACTDSDACTENDQCWVGSCYGYPMYWCTDGECLDASCDPVLGCQVTVFPNETPCDDGDACTNNDNCFNGTCEYGSGSLDCEDYNPCTNDGCNAATGCVNNPVLDGTPCDYGCLDGPSGTCTAGVCLPPAGTCLSEEIPTDWRSTNNNRGRRLTNLDSNSTWSVTGVWDWGQIANRSPVSDGIFLYQVDRSDGCLYRLSTQGVGVKSSDCVPGTIWGSPAIFSGLVCAPSTGGAPVPFIRCWKPDMTLAWHLSLPHRVEGTLSADEGVLSFVTRPNTQQSNLYEVGLAGNILLTVPRTVTMNGAASPIRVFGDHYYGAGDLYSYVDNGVWADGHTSSTPVVQVATSPCGILVARSRSIACYETGAPFNLKWKWTAGLPNDSTLRHVVSLGDSILVQTLNQVIRYSLNGEILSVFPETFQGSVFSFGLIGTTDGEGLFTYQDAIWRTTETGATMVVGSVPSQSWLTPVNGCLAVTSTNPPRTTFRCP